VELALSHEERTLHPPLEEAWQKLRISYEARVAEQVRGEPTEEALRSELIFCLLGGFGVPFELALSAAQLVETINPFDGGWDSPSLQDTLLRELERPQFEPRKKDGTCRRYRYPARKSELLVRARDWVVGRETLAKDLVEEPSESKRRDVLCECPGIGLKTASWILRNLGLGRDLAIVDVHILHALQSAGRVGAVRLPRDYFLVEERFCAWCSELGARAAAFDLFLWEWQRGHVPA
jgi:N-glycosylase/DNA lyase